MEVVNDQRVVVGEGLVVRHVAAGGTVDALAGVDIDVQRGRLTAVVGPSGSGKSTLLRLVGCLGRPVEGSLTVDGTDVLAASRRARRRMRRERIGLVAPEPVVNLVDHVDARGNLRLAARQRRVPVEISDALEAVGLGGRERAHIGALSTGEHLRLSVAMALLGPPALVVADEPTSALDPANGKSVAALLRAVADRGTTLLVATHDPEVVAVADDVIRLAHGRQVHS